MWHSWYGKWGAVSDVHTLEFLILLFLCFNECLKIAIIKAHQQHYQMNQKNASIFTKENLEKLIQ